MPWAGFYRNKETRMKLRIEIELDNAAFEGDYGPSEVEGVLNDVVSRLPAPLRHTGRKLNLHDSNGNHVGYAEIVEE